MKMKSSMLFLVVLLLCLPAPLIADEIDDSVTYYRQKTGCTDTFQPPSQDYQLKAFCAQAWEAGCNGMTDQVNMICNMLTQMGSSCDGCGKGISENNYQSQATQKKQYYAYTRGEMNYERALWNVREAVKTDSGPEIRYYFERSYQYLRTDGGLTPDQASATLCQVTDETGHSHLIYGCNN